MQMLELARRATFALLIVVSTSIRISAGEGASIAGNVVDPLGGTISDASVTLLKNEQEVGRTTTDGRGTFTFANVSAGRYQLRVEATAFQTRTTGPIFVGSDSHATVDVMLPIGPLQQDVVVTASASEVPQAQVGSPVSVIDRETLDALAKPDVLDSLRLVPGVQVVQTGQRGGTTSIFVRGGNANFNKVLIDGVPANDIGGGFEFADLPVTGVDRIEILRNPNSVLYGADALSSVINITTRRGTSRVPELSYAIDGGNLGTMRQDLSVGGANGRFDYFSEFSHFDTNNNLPNDAYHNGTYAGTFGWAMSPSTHLVVTGRRTATAQGVPNAIDFYGLADNSSQTNRNTYVSAVLQTQSTSRWHHTVRFTSTDLNYHNVYPSPTGEPFDPFGFGPNYLGNMVTIRGANGFVASGRAILDFGPPPPYPQVFDSSATRRTIAAQTDYSFPRSLNVSAGFRFEDETGFTDSGTRSVATRHNAGGFVEARESLGGRVYVSGGVGFDHNAAFGFAATPRVSVASYLRRPSGREAIGDTKLAFNFGKGIKAPTVSQENSSLFSLLNSAPQGAALISGFGISPIGPERSRSIDVGLEQGLWNQRTRARVTFFDNRFANLIEFVNKSALPSVGIPRDVAATVSFGAYLNSSSYRARGIEAAFDGRIGAFLTLSGAYTYLDAVVTQSFASSAFRPAINPAYPTIPIGTYAPLVGARPFRRAPHSGSLLATYARSSVQLSLAAYFVGRQDGSTSLLDGFFGSSMLLPNHNLLDSYQKIDVSGSYHLNSRVRLYTSVENVFDARYEAPLGYPALPRTVRAGLALTVGGNTMRRP
jgi:vitamin B12 transporter